MRIYRTVLILALTALSLPSLAQSEGGLLVEVGAEKKLSKKFSIGLDADLRTRNDFNTMDRWSVGIGGEFKPIKNLKLDAGYTLLNTNYREEVSFQANGEPKKWRPSYWGIRHRFSFSATGSYKFSNNLRISLRERWQYTYRPEKTVQRFNFDEEKFGWEDKVRSGKGKNQLRSRFQVEYDKKHALFTPFASVELYNSMAVEKIRYTIGTDLNLSKQHSFSVFYRFQDMHNVEPGDYDPDMHYIGAGYKFNF